MSEECGNCLFWKELSEKEKDEYHGDGRCRYKPPTVVGTDTMWPLTYVHDWCGAHDLLHAPEDDRPDAAQVAGYVMEDGSVRWKGDATPTARKNLFVVPADDDPITPRRDS